MLGILEQVERDRKCQKSWIESNNCFTIAGFCPRNRQSLMPKLSGAVFQLETHPHHTGAHQNVLRAVPRSDVFKTSVSGAVLNIWKSVVCGARCLVATEVVSRNTAPERESCRFESDTFVIFVPGLVIKMCDLQLECYRIRWRQQRWGWSWPSDAFPDFLKTFHI